jgi:hypothetical protein
VTRAWITLRDELGRALTSEWTTGISVDGEEWLAFNGDFELVQSTTPKDGDSFALSIHLTAPDSIDPDYGAGDEILGDKFNYRADSEIDL